MVSTEELHGTNARILFCVQLIEKKIKDFISTAELMVHDEHYDSANIRREIEVLKNKWSTFHTSVRDYRSQLDNSILYFTLIEEVDYSSSHLSVFACLFFFTCMYHSVTGVIFSRPSVC